MHSSRSHDTVIRVYGFVFTPLRTLAVYRALEGDLRYKTVSIARHGPNDHASYLRVANHHG